jgi:apolipoprotein N-acyltransferase
VNSLFNNPKVITFLLPFIGGLLFPTGFPMGEFKGLVITPILGMTLFFLAIHFPQNGEKNETGSSLKAELLALLFFSLGYCIAGYYWIPFTLKEFGQIPFPFNQVLGLLFSLIIAPHFLLFILSKNIVSKFKLKSLKVFKSRSGRNLFYAFIITAFEYYTPQQFPGHLGQPWLTIAPYIGLAPIVGTPVFSFLSFWLVLSLVDWIKNRRLDKLAFVVFSLFLVINISFPLKKLGTGQVSKTNIRMVQANIGNFMKIQSEGGSLSFMREVYQTYEDLSTKETEKPLDLIVWPETAYPNLLTSELLKSYPSSTPGLFKKIIEKMDAELFIGGYDRNTKAIRRNFEGEFNTVFHFDTFSNLKSVYHKMKLIPFGEGLPFGPMNEFLSKLITNVSYFAEGKNYTLFRTKNDTPFIAHICYEILFSWFTSDYLNAQKIQPEFIINLTNDSWYGDTNEPYQHLYLAHWRALEFNIPIVRMTNTGITSVLYPDGSESKRTKIGVKEVLDIELETTKREATPFQKYGFLITFFLWIVLTAVSFAQSIISSRKSLP